MRVLLQWGLYNSVKLHPADFIWCKNSTSAAANSTLGQRVGKYIEISCKMLGTKIFSTSVAPVLRSVYGHSTRVGGHHGYARKRTISMSDNLDHSIAPTSYLELSLPLCVGCKAVDAVACCSAATFISVGVSSVLG